MIFRYQHPGMHSSRLVGSYAWFLFLTRRGRFVLKRFRVSVSTVSCRQMSSKWPMNTRCCKESGQCCPCTVLFAGLKLVPLQIHLPLVSLTLLKKHGNEQGVQVTECRSWHGAKRATCAYPEADPDVD